MVSVTSFRGTAMLVLLAKTAMSVDVPVFLTHMAVHVGATVVERGDGLAGAAIADRRAER